MSIGSKWAGEKPRLISVIFFACVMLFYKIAIHASEEDLEKEIISTGKCSYSLTLTSTTSKEIIWQLWEEVENWKSYDTVLQYSYLVEDSKFEVGAIGYVKAKGAPKTKFEITQMELGDSFVESLKLPLWNTLELKRKVVSVNQGEVEFTHEVEFKGPLRGLMYSLLAKRFKTDLKMVMVNMKGIAEAKSREPL